MDGMMQALQSIGSPGGGDGNWLSKIIPLLGVGSGVMGTVGNIQANNSKNQVLSAEMKQMGDLSKLTPDAIAKGTMSLERPLSNSLIHNVTNATSANLAERGLSEAPGIQAQAISQGLAPYELQEQQMAQNAFFQKLGLPISARPSPFGPFPQSTNSSQMWQSLMNRFLNTGGNRQTPYQYQGPQGPTVPAETVQSNTIPNMDMSKLIDMFMGGSSAEPSFAGAG